MNKHVWKKACFSPADRLYHIQKLVQNLSITKEQAWNLVEYQEFNYCKYCELSDVMFKFSPNECISDNEKMIKELLE